MSWVASVVLNKSSLLFDGDWDGFVSAAIIVEAGFNGVTRPVSPRVGRELVVGDSVLVELGPKKIRGAYRSILFDHHGLESKIPAGVGFVAEINDNEVKVLVNAGRVSSVAEVASKVLGVSIPEELMRYTNAVESNPKSLLNTPSYAGYRSLLDVNLWKEWASEGLRGVMKALKLHEEIGRYLLTYISKHRELASVITEEVRCLGKRSAIHIIVCKKEVEVEINGFKVKPALYLARKLQMELEDKPLTAYSIIMYLEPNNYVGRISISAGPLAPKPANELARVFGGGGHEKIAGAPLNLKFRDALRIIRRVIDEVCIH